MNLIDINVDIFKKWIKSNAPSMYSLLRNGSKDGRIYDLEVYTGRSMTDSFKKLYKLIDGQEESSEGLINGSNLLSLEGIVVEYDMWNELLKSNMFEEDGRPYTSDPDAGVKDNWWNPLWVPFTADGAGNSLCIDLDPGSGGVYGQVITMWHDSGYRERVADSLDSWFDNYIRGLVSGRYSYVKGLGIVESRAV